MSEFLESLPEGLREAPFLAKAENAEAALQELQNASQFMGNSIRIPTDQSSDEEKAAFRLKAMEKIPGLTSIPESDDIDGVVAMLKTLGMPDDPATYEIDLPEGRQLPTDFESMQKLAHKWGMTKAQFKGMMSEMSSDQWSKVDQSEEARKTDLDGLDVEWGAATATNKAIIDNFLSKSSAPQSIIDAVKDGQMNATDMRWLHSVAKGVQGGTLELAPQDNRSEGAVSPEEATAQIQEILGNRDHPYWISGHPSNRSAKIRMIELQGCVDPANALSKADIAKAVG